jgi:hypothetical protein
VSKTRSLVHRVLWLLPLYELAETAGLQYLTEGKAPIVRVGVLAGCRGSDRVAPPEVKLRKNT